MDIGSDTEDDKTEETLIEEGETNNISTETTIIGEEDEEENRRTEKVYNLHEDNY